jgi:hypothetical protein
MWMACRTPRMWTPRIVICIVPAASMPSASSCAPSIANPSTAGIRSLSHTWGFTDSGAAVPPCVPVKRNAGPLPAMTTREAL